MSTGPSNAPVRRLTAAQARRAVLHALGLSRRRPTGRVDRRHFRRLYRDLAVIQIDPINVLARAHHQVAMTRLGPFDRDAFDAYVWRSGEVVETWAHVDATTEVEQWPLLAHRRAQTLPWRAVKAVMDRRPDYLAEVLAEVGERGELSAAQLRDPGERLRSWGSRSMGRAALDYHHLRGDLAISFRDRSMTAWFDLADRVIPQRWLSAPIPTETDAAAALLLRATRAMGLGTVADIADHFRQSATTARGLLGTMQQRGDVMEVEVDGWQGPVYADPDLVVPRAVEAMALVNPFDPLMWNRPRVQRLFGVDYTIEIYVPKAQRRFGYYVLGFLHGEELTALVDLKHDRHRNVIVVAACHCVVPTAPALVAGPLAEELHTWARWLGADAIVVDDAGDLSSRLRVAVAAGG